MKTIQKTTFNFGSAEQSVLICSARRALKLPIHSHHAFHGSSRNFAAVGTRALSQA